MSDFVITVTYLMGAGTLVINIGLVAFIIGTLCSRTWKEWLHERLGSHGVMVALAIVVASLVGSLFYSMIAGFSACLFCWIVRGLIYPQIALLLGYLHHPKRWMLDIALVMSSLSLIVSLYQVWLQFGGASVVNCDIGGLGSCSVEYFRVFGYINLPVMSLIASAALVVAQAVALHRKHWINK